jgi:hypothetical protein
LHRKLFWAVVHEIDRDTSPKSPTWRAHYARLYVDGQVAALRRLVGGRDKNEISLTRLLSTLHDHAPTITINRLSAIAVAVANATMTEQVARHNADTERNWGNGSGYLKPEIIQADLEALRSDTERVREWATRTVAHIDRRGATSPTFGELDTAIAHATEAFRKYGILLTGNDYAVDGNEPDLAWREPLKHMFDDNEDGTE